MQETQVLSPGEEDPWGREWQPTPVFLAGKFHRERSVVSYSSWGHKELDMTERLSLHSDRTVGALLGNASFQTKHLGVI